MPRLTSIILIISICFYQYGSAFRVCIDSFGESMRWYAGMLVNEKRGGGVMPEKRKAVVHIEHGKKSRYNIGKGSGEALIDKRIAGDSRS